MGSGHNFEKFKAAVIDKSTTKDWLEAKPEWELHMVYHDGSDRACECGHQPIHQICVIRNRRNGHELEVGNVCVHNFMQLASRRIFAVLRRVAADPSRSLNPAALELFEHRGAISPHDVALYKKYWRKRLRLSEEQREHKAAINEQVLRYVDAEQKRLVSKFVSMKLTPRGYLKAA